MNDPYWPWWSVILFFGSGVFNGWLFTLWNRPKHVNCPNCDRYVKTITFREHFKECVF